MTVTPNTLKHLTPAQRDDIASLKGPVRPISEDDYNLAFLIGYARIDRKRRREAAARKRAALARDRIG